MQMLSARSRRGRLVVDSMKSGGLVRRNLYSTHPTNFIVPPYCVPSLLRKLGQERRRDHLASVTHRSYVCSWLSLPLHHAFDNMPTYDKDATVQAMRDLYEVIMRMADLSPTALAILPPDWQPPAGTRKSATVIDLMASLPYITDASKEVHLAHQTSAVNYLSPYRIGMFVPFDPYGMVTTEEDFGHADISVDEIVLTMQNDSIGRILILHTRTGKCTFLSYILHTGLTTEPRSGERNQGHYEQTQLCCRYECTTMSSTLSA